MPTENEPYQKPAGFFNTGLRFISYEIFQIKKVPQMKTRACFNESPIWVGVPSLTVEHSENFLYKGKNLSKEYFGTAPMSQKKLLGQAGHSIP